MQNRKEGQNRPTNNRYMDEKAKRTVSEFVSSVAVFFIIINDTYNPAIFYAINGIR